MSLSSLLYTPLKEEENTLNGWHKSTIDYVLKHRSKICASIRGIAKSLGKILQRIDVDEIYQEILTYMYTCDDYDISKAYERSNTGNVVSLDGYIHSCIKCCVRRYICDIYKKQSNEISNISKDNDGKEISLFDTIKDDKAYVDEMNQYMYDLDDILRNYESERYAFGPDIYQIWYIRLQTLLHGKKDRYNDILKVLGISKKELIAVEGNAVSVMLSIAKAISLTDLDYAIKAFEKYTYSAKKIEKVIKSFQ